MPSPVAAPAIVWVDVVSTSRKPIRQKRSKLLHCLTAPLLRLSPFFLPLYARLIIKTSILDFSEKALLDQLSFKIFNGFFYLIISDNYLHVSIPGWWESFISGLRIVFSQQVVNSLPQELKRKNRGSHGGTTKRSPYDIPWPPNVDPRCSHSASLCRS